VIEKVRIQNFKCLRDVTVELGPFTVLIGPNDTGKTSFLQAIHTLGLALNENMGAGLQQVLGGDYPSCLGVAVWQRDTSLSVAWRVWGRADTTGSAFEYALALPADGSIHQEALTLDNKAIYNAGKEGSQVVYTALKSNLSTPHTRGVNVLSRCAQLDRHEQHLRVELVRQALQSSAIYHFNCDQMRYPAPTQTDPDLSSSGSNLASVVDCLLRGPDRDVVLALEKQLHDSIPSLRGLATTPTPNGDQGARALQFALAGNYKPPRTRPANHVSDGAILLTAFLTLAHASTQPLLLIEEPENGLHPDRLQLVVDVLRRISTGAVGNRPRQVIITSHSPILLNAVAPNEVRIFRRTKEGDVVVTPMNSIPGIERLEKDFGPGELWHLFGEEELVAGKAQ
jgi:predicted ATPase